MATMLKTGKLLRLVSGAARAQVQQQQQGQGNQGSSQNAPHFLVVGSQKPGSGGGAGTGAESNSGQAQFQQGATWTFAQMSNALPILSGDNERVLRDILKESEGESPIILTRSITKEEIEHLLQKIPLLEKDSDRKMIQWQSLSVLRSCGRLLAGDEPDPAARTDFANSVWTRLEDGLGAEINVLHYNALLSVYLENDHVFCPHQMLVRLQRRKIEPNKETYEALLKRYIQLKDMEGVSKMLTHIKANLNPEICLQIVQMCDKNRDLEVAKEALKVTKLEKENALTDKILTTLATVAIDMGNYETAVEYAAKIDKESDVEMIVFKLVTAKNEGDPTEDDPVKYATAILAAREQTKNGANQTSSSSLHDEIGSKMAQSLVSGCLKQGHVDAAFLLVKTFPEKMVQVKIDPEKFLRDILASERLPSLSKLLWYTEELDRLDILKDGSRILLEAALENRHYQLALKLAEIRIQEGKTLETVHKETLIRRAGGNGDAFEFLPVVKDLAGGLTREDLTQIVIPLAERIFEGNIHEALEKLQSGAGIDFSVSVPAAFHRLLQNNRVMDAHIMAGSYHNYISPEQLDYFYSLQRIQNVPASPAPSAELHPQQPTYIQMFNNLTQMYESLPLATACQMFRAEGRYWDLENFLATCVNTSVEERRGLYMQTLLSYMDHGLYEKALILAERLESEGLDFFEFQSLMSEFADSFVQQQQQQYHQQHQHQAYHHQQQPQSITYNGGLPSAPQSTIAGGGATPSEISSHRSTPSIFSQRSSSYHHSHNVHIRNMKRQLAKDISENPTSLLRSFDSLATESPVDYGHSLNTYLSVTELSSLIECLVKNDRVNEASVVAESMLSKESYPLPKIFRFLLNKMASEGHVDMMEKIGRHLTPRVKREVSFDNRLCNAYLAAGRGEEFLEKMTAELAAARDDDEAALTALKDKFPRGGAMGLLENYPNLIDSYAKLAREFVTRCDYVAPMNVLWTYYFINGRKVDAAPLWDAHVKSCPQIMFQKICQTARNKQSLQMASDLVDLLHDAKVTVGAQGIAYSCLLDVLSARKDYETGMVKLEEGLKRGMKLDDVNRTALVRLKNGLEDSNKDFPYEIPKKTKDNSHSRITTTENSRAVSPAFSMN